MTWKNLTTPDWEIYVEDSKLQHFGPGAIVDKLEEWQVMEPSDYNTEKYIISISPAEVARLQQVASVII